MLVEVKSPTVPDCPDQVGPFPSFEDDDADASEDQQQTCNITSGFDTVTACQDRVVAFHIGQWNVRRTQQPDVFVRSIASMLRHSLSEFLLSALVHSFIRISLLLLLLSDTLKC